MRPRLIAATLSLLALTACKSAFVDTTIANRTGSDLSVVQLDYPSASLGTSNLKSDADFHYRFKIQGSKPLKLSWTDAQHQDHTLAGPTLYEGQQGELRITIKPEGSAVFAPALTPAH